MAIKNSHTDEYPIPDGFEIYANELEVAGVSHRKNDARAFVKARLKWIELEREAENKFDKNAIKVIGYSKGLIFKKCKQIGYVPKEISKLIVENGYWGKVRVRLQKTYLADSGFVEILFQVLGPKGEREIFDPPFKEEGGHYTDYVEWVKQLKSEGKFDEALTLLNKLIEETEKEAKDQGPGYGVAPWYYEQAAIIFRKLKLYEKEVKVLERYDEQPKAPGMGPQKLAERLIKAREIMRKKRV